ncbi:5,10-methenyltetrahydrofolate synthetase [Scheffersomyces xylosifermentans]|uniref:5,10-methenyltetrahydrofolate synthetase n=1 Tax=Scheffersomyces xylosifermentans TaxID=1304137 RepID=UPI00315D52C3
MLSAPLKQTKKQLRKSIKSSLKLIPQASLLAQSEEIHQKLLSHPHFNSAKKVAVYMNMPDSEVKTSNIIQSCYILGKTVYLPKCNVEPSIGRKNNYLSMLRVPVYDDVLRLEPQGKYKLLEPVQGEDAMNEGDLDLIIMPGVAFTESKVRMGHGAGFYDEFLNVYFKKYNRKPYLIGIGLQEQLADFLPKEEHDWNLDSLIISGHDIIY